MIFNQFDIKYSIESIDFGFLVSIIIDIKSIREYRIVLLVLSLEKDSLGLGNIYRGVN